MLSIVLANLRQVRGPIARQGHGSPSTERAGHHQGGQSRAGPSTVGKRAEAPGLLDERLSALKSFHFRVGEQF